MSRVVLDTNVAISALLFRRGSLSWLRETWSAGRFVPLASRDTTLEIMRVLAYPKFTLTDDERHDLLSDYLPYCETVVIPRRKRRLPSWRDPHDRKFLELALAGRADYLVTGDRDLLSIGGFRVPIVEPARFRAALATHE